MIIGIIGAPNKGKSTLFSAMTMNDVGIADFPFTTIDPNIGIATATSKCVETELGIKCNPRLFKCRNGVREIPINVIDVAGLVEGAHTGRGMGNKFLNDIAQADALIIVIDASGKTDSRGNKCDESNPLEDIEMVKNELVEWIADIIERHSKKLRANKNYKSELERILGILDVKRHTIDKSELESGINLSKDTDRNSIKLFSDKILQNSKKIIVCANKSDSKEADKNIDLIRNALGNNVIFCSAAIELALNKAEMNGIIRYNKDEAKFDILKTDISNEQIEALEYMHNFLVRKGTNVQNLINRVTFELLDNIVVYPVEDENRYSDRFGKILPDAILIKNGSTAYDLAEKIHTDIAKGMLYAIDAKTKMRIGKNYILKNGDIIKIVSTIR